MARVELTIGDQLEMGTAVVGGSVDNETLNAMIRQEMDERALAAQVQKHGPGHGRDAVAQAVAPDRSRAHRRINCMYTCTGRWLTPGGYRKRALRGARAEADLDGRFVTPCFQTTRMNMLVY